MICEACQHKNPSQNLTCERCRKKLFRAKLRVTMGSGQVQIHYLFPKRYSLGRNLNNDIPIGHTSVSRYHAEIDYKNGTFYIVDKGSKNGSYLNNNRIKRSKLQDLDCIQLGDAILHYVDDENKLHALTNKLSTDEWVQKELFNFAQKKQTKITTDDVLLTMIDLAVSLIHADQAVVLQFDQSNKLRFKVGEEQKKQNIFENKLSEYDWTIINDAVRKKEINFVCKDDNQKNTTDSDLEQSIWYKMAIPLITTYIKGISNNQLGLNGIVGVLFFTQDKNTTTISKRKNDILSTIVQQITYAVQSDILYEQALDKRKVEEELLLAKEIQQRLLPTTLPQFDQFEIATFIQPCETVSGDYFDFIPVSNTTLGIAIGDICGKGVPAALLNSTVQAAIHSQLEFTISTEEIINNLNRLLIRSTAESIFLTLFFGILDIETGTLKYINAGHPPPIVISGNREMKELCSTIPPLGIIEKKLNPERMINFSTGDILVMYTDGIIESHNRDNKIYSRKRLINLINSLCSKENSDKFKPESLVNRITNDLTEFIEGKEQRDDLTLLAVKRK